MRRLNLITKKQDKVYCEACAVDAPAQVQIKESRRRKKHLISVVIVLPLLIILYKFLPGIVDYFTFNLIKLKPESHFGEAVNFFFYDTIKILILLFLISSLMGAVNAYFPVDRLRIYLTTKKM